MRTQLIYIYCKNIILIIYFLKIYPGKKILFQKNLVISKRESVFDLFLQIATQENVLS